MTSLMMMTPVAAVLVLALLADLVPAATAAKAQLRFFHSAYGLDTVDIYVNASQRVASEVNFGQATGIFVLEPGEMLISAKLTATGKTVFQKVLELEDGTVTNLVVVLSEIREQGVLGYSDVLPIYRPKPDFSRVNVFHIAVAPAVSISVVPNGTKPGDLPPSEITEPGNPKRVGDLPSGFYTVFVAAPRQTADKEPRVVFKATRIWIPAGHDVFIAIVSDEPFFLKLIIGIHRGRNNSKLVEDSREHHGLPPPADVSPPVPRPTDPTETPTSTSSKDTPSPVPIRTATPSPVSKDSGDTPPKKTVSPSLTVSPTPSEAPASSRSPTSSAQPSLSESPTSPIATPFRHSRATELPSPSPSLPVTLNQPIPESRSPQTMTSPSPGFPESPIAPSVAPTESNDDDEVCIGVESTVSGRPILETVSTARMQSHPLIGSNIASKVLCARIGRDRLCATATHILTFDGQHLYMRELCNGPVSCVEELQKVFSVKTESGIVADYAAQRIQLTHSAARLSLADYFSASRMVALENTAQRYLNPVWRALTQ